MKFSILIDGGLPGINSLTALAVRQDAMRTLPACAAQIRDVKLDRSARAIPTRFPLRFVLA
jgi:hypothetical protein